MLFKKYDKSGLIFTSVDVDTPIIRLSGDYIKILEILERNFHEHLSPTQDLSANEYSHFINFLHKSGFQVEMTSEVLDELRNEFSYTPVGDFHLEVETSVFQPYNLEIFASRGSMNGTDGYGNAEACESGMCE